VKIVAEIEFDSVERDAADLVIRDEQILERLRRSPEEALALLSLVKSPLTLEDIFIQDDGRIVIKRAFPRIDIDAFAPAGQAYIQNIINENCYGIRIFNGVMGVNWYCGQPYPGPG
jgi:hypothetical protein